MSSSSHLPATRASLVQADEAKTPTEAISILYKIVQDPDDWESIKREAVIKLALLLTQEGRAGEIQDLIIKAFPFFSSISCEVTAAEALRSIIDEVAKVPETYDLQISLYTQIVECSRADENHTYLREQMEESLAGLLIDCRKSSEAFNLLLRLAADSRKSDDDLRRIRIYGLRTKLHLSCEDIPKAKAALTEAHETAESLLIIPEDDQAMLDMQSGIFHTQEREYLNAYNCFCKACSAFDNLEDPMYTLCLRYLVLCRIILNRAGEVRIVSSDKYRNLYHSEEFKGMRAVADARAKDSVELFEAALKDYKDELQKDPLVHKHLHDTAIKDKLCKLIETCSGSVKIAKIAESIDLPADEVRRYLSEMIVDEKLAGSLDEVAGCLIIDPKNDNAAPDIISGCRYSQTKVWRMNGIISES